MQIIQKSMLLVAVGMIAGCASVAVNEDVLTQRTSSALGLNPSQFTISGRTDSGVRTDYSVRTMSGKNYACYVTGMFSLVGRAVSDAVCSEVNAGADAASQKSKSGGSPCNALLKAAGKCK